jgi:hypothetical protein
LLLGLPFIEFIDGLEIGFGVVHEIHGSPDHVNVLLNTAGRCGDQNVDPVIRALAWPWSLGFAQTVFLTHPRVRPDVRHRGRRSAMAVRKAAGYRMHRLL